MCIMYFKSKQMVVISAAIYKKNDAAIPVFFFHIYQVAFLV